MRDLANADLAPWPVFVVLLEATSLLEELVFEGAAVAGITASAPVSPPMRVRRVTVKIWEIHSLVVRELSDRVRAKQRVSLNDLRMPPEPDRRPARALDLGNVNGNAVIFVVLPLCQLKLLTGKYSSRYCHSPRNFEPTPVRFFMRHSVQLG